MPFKPYKAKTNQIRSGMIHLMQANINTTCTGSELTTHEANLPGVGGLGGGMGPPGPGGPAMGPNCCIPGVWGLSWPGNRGRIPAISWGGNMPGCL